MIDIVMLRHAEPEWEPEGRAVSNPGLTEYGQTQALCVARTLGREHFDHFYVSPLVRACETAQPISEALEMEPAVLSWMEEIRLPSMDGRPADQVHAYLRTMRARELDKWWEGPLGGESFRHFRDRITGGLEPLLVSSHRATIHAQGGHRIWRLPEEDQRLLFVAHLGSISVMLSHLLGLEPVPWIWEQFQLDWANLVRVKSNQIAGGSVWALKAFNQCDHLADLPKHPGPAWTKAEVSSSTL